MKYLFKLIAILVIANLSLNAAIAIPDQTKSRDVTQQFYGFKNVYYETTAQ